MPTTDGNAKMPRTEEDADDDNDADNNAATQRMGNNTDNYDAAADIDAAMQTRR